MRKISKSSYQKGAGANDLEVRSSPNIWARKFQVCDELVWIMWRLKSHKIISSSVLSMNLETEQWISIVE